MKKKILVTFSRVITFHSTDVRKSRLPLDRLSFLTRLSVLSPWRALAEGLRPHKDLSRLVLCVPSLPSLITYTSREEENCNITERNFVIHSSWRNRNHFLSPIDLIHARSLINISRLSNSREQHEQKMVNGEQHVNGLSNGHHSDKHKSSSHKSSSKDKHRDKDRSREHKSSKSSHR